MLNSQQYEKAGKFRAKVSGVMLSTVDRRGSLDTISKNNNNELSLTYSRDQSYVPLRSPKHNKQARTEKRRASASLPASPSLAMRDISEIRERVRMMHKEQADFE